MELFNKLEDVISFVLTSHGKKMLATGSFNPTYYAFSDSDVMYDTKYAPIFPQGTSPMTMSQNRTSEELVLKDRPKPSTFPSTSENDFGKNFFKVGLLGTSELGNNLYPAFELKVHDGRMSGSSYITGTFLNQNIPTVNINMVCRYDTEFHIFDTHETLLLEVTELNGLFEKENFEYSILRRYDPIVRTGPVPLFLWKPDELLEFVNRYQDNEDDDDEVLPLALIPDQIPPSTVEYWLDIDVDEEISETISFTNSLDGNIYLRPENVEPKPENC